MMVPFWFDDDDVVVVVVSLIEAVSVHSVNVLCCQLRTEHHH